MTNQITITVSGTTLQVASPYNPDFPKAARALGGKWHADSKTWQFDTRDETRVRDLCMDIYGTDGRPVAAGDLVTLRITLEDGWYLDQRTGPLFFAGREIGRAFGRDSGARQGDGIVFLKGSVTSGGSAKNWETRTTKGAIFEIRDLPRAAAEKAKTEVEQGVILEIIEPDTTATDHRAALEAERAALMARIAEIDTALGDTDSTEQTTPPTTPTQASSNKLSKPAAFLLLAIATGHTLTDLALSMQSAAASATGQMPLFI